MVIALNEKIVRYQKRIGLQGYEGLPFGTYLIRINEKTFKIQLLQITARRVCFTHPPFTFAYLPFFYEYCISVINK